jgi:hypothetical protein
MEGMKWPRFLHKDVVLTFDQNCLRLRRDGRMIAVDRDCGNHAGVAGNVRTAVRLNYSTCCPGKLYSVQFINHKSWPQ